MKSKSRPSKHPARMTDKGREIVASLTELVEVLEAGGSDIAHFPSRRVSISTTPGSYDPARVRATRLLIGADQNAFANLLGVTMLQVRSWERGERAPAPWARRLLDEVNRDPRHWQKMLGPSAA